MSIRPAPRLLLPLFFINATLVLCHEVDSAYWHEWELFHLPGRAAGFVAMHLLLVPLILAGLVVVARGNPAARWSSFAIGIAGCAGCAVHLAFLADGNERFSTPFSIALVVAFGLSSGALAVVAATARRTGKHRGTTLAGQSLIVLALVLSAGPSAVADGGLEILTFPVGLVTGEHTIGHIADTLPPAIEIAGRRSGLLENTDVKRPQGETLPANSE